MLSCVTIDSEDREIIALSTRLKERRQAPGQSVHYNKETNLNGDLRNESQKTSTYANASGNKQAAYPPQLARSQVDLSAVARKSEGGNASNLRLSAETISLAQK